MSSLLLFLITFLSLASPALCPEGTRPVAHCDLILIDQGAAFEDCFEYGREKIALTRVSWHEGQIAEADWYVQEQGLLVKGVIANEITMASVFQYYVPFRQITLTAHYPMQSITWCGVQGYATFFPLFQVNQ